MASVHHHAGSGDKASDVSGAPRDFSITYMQSQTSYYHRFIRFKNFDQSR